jgi:hypothetical protein
MRAFPTDRPSLSRSDPDGFPVGGHGPVPQPERSGGAESTSRTRLQIWPKIADTADLEFAACAPSGSARASRFFLVAPCQGVSALPRSVGLCDRRLLLSGLGRVILNSGGGSYSGHPFGFGGDPAQSWKNLARKPVATASALARSWPPAQGGFVYSCARCGAPFAATRSDRKYCDECKVNHHNKSDIDRTAARTRMSAGGQGYVHADSTTPLSSSPPAWCGACRSMVIWDGGSACPICGSPWPRRRASRKLRLEVAERDGWICHRCRKPIDPALPMVILSRWLPTTFPCPSVMTARRSPRTSRRPIRCATAAT